MKKNLLIRFLTFFSLSSIFLQTLLPFYYAFPKAAYAQDITPTEAVTPTLEPTVVPTIDPTTEPTATPTVEPTIAPIIEPTIEPTIAISPSVEPTVEPTKTPSGEILDGISTQITPTITVLPTAAATPQVDEVVQAEIVKLDGSYANSDLIPATWTDKLDYAPTEKALVSGKNFIPNSVYSIIISSSDNPAITHTNTFTTLSDGTFTYEYQLDGNYRPNYKVEVKDGSGLIVASITFTDTAPEFNGTEKGIITNDETGVVTGTLTGTYALTISGNLTAYTENSASFTGTVTGGINGSVTASINSNGIDTMAGTITGTGAIYPVRIIGIFPKTGIDGDFEGEIITGTVPTLITSMTISGAAGADTVVNGGTLSMSADVLPVDAANKNIAWSIWWDAENLSHGEATINEDTGILTGTKVGPITVVAKALDGSLKDATKVITVEADTTPPTCSISLTENPDKGYQHILGNTFYYGKDNAFPDWSGNVLVTVSSTDDVGVQQVVFPNVFKTSGTVDGQTITTTPYSKNYYWHQGSPAQTGSGVGTHTVTCYDDAGNTNTATFNVVQDNNHPSFTTVTLDNYFVKNGATVNVTANATDADSGIKECFARWSTDTSFNGIDLGDLGTDCAGPITVPNGDGTFYVVVKTGDNVGYFPSEVASSAITVDNTKPVISSVLPTSSTLINNITTSSDVSYTLDENIGSGTITITQDPTDLSPDDPGSPHTCTLVGTALNAGTHSNLDLSDTVNGCTIAQTLLSGAIYIFDFDASDLAGNVADTITSTTVVYDAVAPVVEITAPVATQEVKDDYKITFTDNDLKHPKCSIDNSVWVPCTSGVTTLNDVTGFGALGEGAFSLYLKDTDDAGNTGTDSKVGVIKDTTNPASPGTPATSVTSPTNITSITWSWTAATESIKNYIWNLWKSAVKIDSGTTSNTSKTLELSSYGGGAFTFDVRSEDYAGNVSGVMTSLVTTIDLDAPAIESVADIVKEATSTSGATVTITPPISHDAIDGDLSSTCDKSTGLFPIGETTVTCSKTDAAGNVATPITFTVTVQDTIAPVSTATAGSYIYDSWTKNNVTVTFGCTDSGSGCVTTPNDNQYPYHCIDSTNTCTPDEATYDLLISGEGAWYVRYFSRDNEGNIENPVKSVGVKIDKTAPVIALNGTVPDIEINHSFTDPGATASDEVDGSFAATASGTVNTTLVGSYDITYDAVDTAGNHALSVIRTVNVVDSIADAFDIISANLSAEGSDIANNLNEVNTNNVTNFSNLYFEKWLGGVKMGRLTFTGGLNLADTATQTFLQNLGTKLDQNNGRIAFDVSDSDAFSGMGASLVMYNMPPGITQTQLVVRDDSGTILSPAGIVSAFDQDPETYDISFDAAHFTQFDVDTTAPTKPVANPEAGDYASDQEVALSSTDSGTGIKSIYYTLDGSTPDSTKTLYSGKITVDKDMTIKAIAYDNASNASDVLVATYGISPKISSESEASSTSSTATITWLTYGPSTSRVIYDTVTHAVLGSAPNYGYAYSTIEDSTKVTSHSVGLTGLSTGTTYYYRVISHGSPEEVGAEKNFSITCTAVKPESPGPLTLTRVNDTEVKVVWGSVADPVTNYQVTWSKDTDIDGDGDGSKTVGKVTETNITGLELNKYGYYFKVRAINDCNSGEPNGILFIGSGSDLRASTPSSSSNVLGTSTESNYGQLGELNTPTEDLEQNVLGASSLTPAPVSTGVVLGTAGSDKKTMWWWPWILALLLPIGVWGYLKWKKKDDGI